MDVTDIQNDYVRGMFWKFWYLRNSVTSNATCLKIVPSTYVLYLEPLTMQLVQVSFFLKIWVQNTLSIY